MRFSSTDFKACFSALLFTVCSHSVFANGDLKITDGEHIEEGKYPYFSALTTDYIEHDSFPSNINCGGVIIAGRYFLSATHCFAKDDTPTPWWSGKKPGHQFPENAFGALKANIVVGLEKVDFDNRKPEIFTQELNISGESSLWENSDWMFYKDIIVLDLDKYIEKDLVLDKAVYLGNYEAMIDKQSARVMGFGSTHCLSGNCSHPDGNTDYLLQTTVSLEKDCGLTSNQIPTDLDWWPSSMDELVCSTSNKFSYDDVGYSNANHGDSGGPIVVEQNGIDLTYGVTHAGIYQDETLTSTTNRVVLYQAFTGEVIKKVAPFFNSWNGPTIIKVSEIGKEITFAVQNLTPEHVNLLDDSSLKSSNNITITANSNCNKNVDTFERCELTFTLDNDQDGFIELITQKNTLTVAVKYEPASSSNENVRPLNPTEGSEVGGGEASGNGSGGGLSVYVLFFLLTTYLLRSSFSKLEDRK
ncbi:trypsin-like serine protease [Vibrio lentus]|uniref:trypsin-like serine protease n=1 Tax=Vibrio lentus TaxID=136468 RepID=UPI000C82D207|nr:trypsin-like serine protease [Vibrio lentus]PMG76434.1 hypothetical protein BCU86_22140 [Vibrio lentus]PMI53193.1 hypothetical protein BCU43_18615 [Vibrio lentus]PMI78820.1 hypothetical protein BCU36_20860 [Vibrio lentus]PMJ03439.1 hypothetical protein BCU32_21865 [Vibrio lentus]